MRPIYTLFSIAVVTFWVDFGSKIAAKLLLSSTALPVLGSFFSLQLQKNTGIAFSFPLPLWAQIAGSILLLATGGVFVAKRVEWRTSAMIASLGLLLGGAIGNLSERIISGTVTDFFAFSFFPTFNIADMAIFTGIVGLLFFSKTA